MRFGAAGSVGTSCLGLFLLRGPAPPFRFRRRRSVLRSARLLRLRLLRLRLVFGWLHLKLRGQDTTRPAKPDDVAVQVGRSPSSGRIRKGPSMWSTLKGLAEEAGGAAGSSARQLAQLQVVQDEPVVVGNAQAVGGLAVTLKSLSETATLLRPQR